MAAKLNTTKRISLQHGSKASGATIPAPGGLRGGGQTVKTLGGGGSKGDSNTNGPGGFGRSRGIQKGR